jgi:hypothetical protein
VAFPAAPQIAHPAVACSRFPSRGRLGYAQIVLPAQKKLSARAALVRAPLSQTGSTPCWGQIARTIVEEILGTGRWVLLN